MGNEGRERRVVRSPRVRWRSLAAVVALAAAMGLTPHVSSGSPLPHGEPDATVIIEWNQVAMDVLTPSGRPLLTQPAVIAAMHVAMYDAVMAIERYAEPFSTGVSAPDGASGVAAAAAAAHRVLVGFLPMSTVTFDVALERTLSNVPDGHGEADGVAVGEAAGWGVLAVHLHGGTQTGPLPAPLPAGPGVWVPTPPATVGLAPWLALARPFALRSADQFRPGPPPALGSRPYQRALEEVRVMGGAVSSVRTPEQTVSARFWADQPVAQGQRALRAKARELGWGLAATARMFAAVMTSEADAVVACWDAKFHYQLWRPWQSVPEVEPGWTPLLPTPSHPEYPSAHGCVTGALAFALEQVLGTSVIELTIDAANIGVERRYTTRDDLLEEVGNARIWGGLHYRFSVDAGTRIAERVVAWNLRHNFRLLN